MGDPMNEPYYVRLRNGYALIDPRSRYVYTSDKGVLRASAVDVKDLERVDADLVHRQYAAPPSVMDDKAWRTCPGKFKDPDQEYASYLIVDTALRILPAKDEVLGPGKWMPTANGIVFGCPYCGRPVVTDKRIPPWAPESLNCIDDDRGASGKGCGKHLYAVIQGVYEATSPFKKPARRKRVTK